MLLVVCCIAGCFVDLFGMVGFVSGLCVLMLVRFAYVFVFV